MSHLEYKSLPTVTTSIQDRTVTGIYAVHGNIDHKGDRSHPGSVQVAWGGRKRAVFLWEHDFKSPPTAVIREVKSLTRIELPDRTRSYAPEATGGELVTREYLDTPRGNEALASVSSGAVEEMSYGFLPDGVEFTTEGKRKIRELKSSRLLDISDVLIGMNPATVAVKSGLSLPLDEHFSMVLDFMREYADRVADLKRLRETDHRTLNGVNIDRLIELKSGLVEIASHLDSLLVRPTNPEIKTAMLETLRLQAIALGVKL